MKTQIYVKENNQVLVTSLKVCFALKSIHNKISLNPLSKYVVNVISFLKVVSHKFSEKKS